MNDILVAVGKRHELPQSLIQGMYQLRRRVFRDRLGWQIPDNASTADMEIDEYDHCFPTYVILHRNGKVIASCRLLPTTGRWMLPDLWPEMLAGQPAPCSVDTWELSRFAVDLDDNGDAGAIGFATAKLLRAAFDFADRSQITRYLVVTGAGMERLLRKTSLHMRRMGAPVRTDGALAVANEVFIDAKTDRAILVAIALAEPSRTPVPLIARATAVA